MTRIHMCKWRSYCKSQHIFQGNLKNLVVIFIHCFTHRLHDLHLLYCAYSYLCDFWKKFWKKVLSSSIVYEFSLGGAGGCLMILMMVPFWLHRWYCLLILWFFWINRLVLNLVVLIWDANFLEAFWPVKFKLWNFTYSGSMTNTWWKQPASITGIPSVLQLHKFRCLHTLDEKTHPCEYSYQILVFMVLSSN